MHHIHMTKCKFFALFASPVDYSPEEAKISKVELDKHNSAVIAPDLVREFARQKTKSR